MSDIYKAPEAQLHDPSQPGEFGSMEPLCRVNMSSSLSSLLKTHGRNYQA